MTDFETIARTPCRIRLAWSVDNKIGQHGAWLYTLTEEEYLEGVVRARNRVYGEGTHWLEYQQTANCVDAQ